MSGDPDRIEVLPVLPSLDIAETLAFYRDQLGFAKIVHQTPDYLILRRGEMELHFWLTDDREPAGKDIRLPARRRHCRPSCGIPYEGRFTPVGYGGAAVEHGGILYP
jgi:catechol 2,3-dioxygenase-like lactoylglutathione lyase family enzyme